MSVRVNLLKGPKLVVDFLLALGQCILSVLELILQIRLLLQPLALELQQLVQLYLITAVRHARNTINTSLESNLGFLELADARLVLS